MSDSAPLTVCGTFTRARRYPLVVARVWGRRVTLNFAVGAAMGLGVVWLTRGLWQYGPLGSRAWLVYAIAGLGMGAFLHRGRLDGRAPLWTIYTVIGWLAVEVPQAVAQRINVRTIEVTVPAAPVAVVALGRRPRAVQMWVPPKTEAA